MMIDKIKQRKSLCDKCNPPKEKKIRSNSNYLKKKSNKGYYDYYKQIIESKGGVIISKEYINARTKLEFNCKNKHLNKKLTCDLKAGGWCPKCSKNKYNGQLNPY